MVGMMGGMTCEAGWARMVMCNNTRQAWMQHGAVPNNTVMRSLQEPQCNIVRFIEGSLRVPDLHLVRRGTMLISYL